MLIGLVGKPSVGKSTFFKASTLAEVDIANYPFTTIKPNHAMGYVRIKDVAKEFGKTADPREGFILDGWRFVPVELMDVAGLVPGAHEGKGMGNQFLDDLRQANVLIHVIDVSGSTNEKGEQVDPGSYDPGKDVRFLEVELDQWYLSILMKGWEKFTRGLQQDKSKFAEALAKQLSGLGVTEEHIADAVRELDLDPEELGRWDNKQLLSLATRLRHKTKPMVIAANKIDVPGAEENLERLRQEFPSYHIIPCSAESELALREASKKDLIDYIPGETDFSVKDEQGLSEKQRQALDYIRDEILKKHEGTGVQQVLNTAVFDLLDHVALHPGGASKLEDKDGNVIPDCFLMPKGTTALDFAYRLHTDFGENFVKAIDVRKRMPVGKDHELEHLDIIEIAAGK